MVDVVNGKKTASDLPLNPMYVNNSAIVGYYKCDDTSYHFQDNGIEEVSGMEYEYQPNLGRIIFSKNGEPCEYRNVFKVSNDAIWWSKTLGYSYNKSDNNKIEKLSKIDTENFLIYNGITYAKPKPIDFLLPSGTIWTDKDLYEGGDIRLTYQEVVDFISLHPEYALPTRSQIEEVKSLVFKDERGIYYWTADKYYEKQYAYHSWRNFNGYYGIEETEIWDIGEGFGIVDKTEKCLVRFVFK